MVPKAKLYFVRFEDKTTKEIFYKFGHTHNYDVLLRFHDDRYYKDMYTKWNIKVMCSAYGPEDLVLKQEEYLLGKYPKNFWLPEKPKGVTEIVKLNKAQIRDIIDYIKQLSQQWYNLRQTVTTI